jgi:hypothetical protein
MHTHYDNLKVSRSAPPDVIRAAYKALCQRYHPDRNRSPDAPRIMRLVNEAYAVLGDPPRRAAYDRELRERERAAGSDHASAWGVPSEAAWTADGAAPGVGAKASGDAATQHGWAPATGAAARAERRRTLHRGLFAAALLCFAAACVLLVANLAGPGRPVRPDAPRAAAPGLPLAPPAPYSWVDPLTQATLLIDGRWQHTHRTDAAGEPIDTFTDRAGAAAVVLAREPAPPFGLARYIPAYLRHNAQAMRLDVPGERDTVDGHPTWSAYGRLVSDPAVHVHVELRDIDGAIWRVVTVQSRVDAAMDTAARALAAQLWGTGAAASPRAPAPDGPRAAVPPAATPRTAAGRVTDTP